MPHSSLSGVIITYWLQDYVLTHSSFGCNRPTGTTVTLGQVKKGEVNQECGSRLWIQFVSTLHGNGEGRNLEKTKERTQDYNCNTLHICSVKRTRREQVLLAVRDASFKDSTESGCVTQANRMMSLSQGGSQPHTSHHIAAPQSFTEMRALKPFSLPTRWEVQVLSTFYLPEASRELVF